MPAPMKLESELDMSQVAGMRSSNRKLARLGVEAVDLSFCAHGHGASCVAQVGRGLQEITIHAASSPVVAVDALVEKVERLRRQSKRRRH